MKIREYVEKSLILAVGSVYNAIWRELRQRLEADHCTHLEAMILITLFIEKKETITPSKLARAFGTTAGNISHCLTRLEKRDLMKRSLDESNARSYKLTLRPEGKKSALRFMRVIDEIETRYESELGKGAVADIVSSIRGLCDVQRLREMRAS